MRIKCSLCGGENEIHPGQKMLSCTYCGSSLAVEDRCGPGHLILPHKRNDRNAKEALSSFLLQKKLAHPKKMKAEFFYVPFLVTETEKGEVETLPGNSAFSAMGSAPYPPAGDYYFFDKKHAGSEKIIPVEKAGKGAVKVLHLPLYRIKYYAAGTKWEAIVMGGSWQIHAVEFPPEQPSSINVSNLLAAAGLLAAYLFIGKLGHGWLGRLAVLLAASAAGFALLSIRRKVVKRD